MILLAVRDLLSLYALGEGLATNQSKDTSYGGDR